MLQELEGGYCKSSKEDALRAGRRMQEEQEGRCSKIRKEDAVRAGRRML